MKDERKVTTLADLLDRADVRRVKFKQEIRALGLDKWMRRRKAKQDVEANHISTRTAH